MSRVRFKPAVTPAAKMSQAAFRLLDTHPFRRARRARRALYRCFLLLRESMAFLYR